ncbi:MAG: DUF6492 family protein [Verrucomicrobia bacterium]|nr:DUF6492 family protein [Verrucomicrobiota bacterium]
MKVVSPCIVRDLPVYRLAYESLTRNLPEAAPHVITRRGDFGQFRNACGSGLTLLDEDGMVPGMTLAELRKHPLPFFPVGAGWYFQQFLKWAFADTCAADEGYLIWDADTILLRPLEFRDAEGRTLLTTSAEFHQPYFETFEALFGKRPAERISFISQHQWIEAGTLKELLGEIESRNPLGNGWAWTVIDHLRGKGTNLFSEYETYGHYCRLRHPGRCVLRTAPWTRAGRQLAGFPPTPAKLQDLAEQYAFASFESNRSIRGHCVHWLRKLSGWY